MQSLARLTLLIQILCWSIPYSWSFTVGTSSCTRTFGIMPHRQRITTGNPSSQTIVFRLSMSSDKDQLDSLTAGVVELQDDNSDGVETVQTSSSSPTPSSAPFLSQRTELDPDALNLDLGDAKQTRVIIYIIISLIPVLFLIPFMLGSRELLPLVDTDLPPVQM